MGPASPGSRAGHVDVDKQYVLAGDLLAINPWGANEPRENLHVFTRVQDPIPGGIEGVWTGVGDTSNWTIVLTPTQFTATTIRRPEERLYAERHIPSESGRAVHHGDGRGCLGRRGEHSWNR